MDCLRNLPLEGASRSYVGYVHMMVVVAGCQSCDTMLTGTGDLTFNIS